MSTEQPVWLDDVPLEVTLVDGSRWIVYYRVRGGFAEALAWLKRDMADGCQLRPSDDVDGVQRRHAHVNLAHIVSVREVEAVPDA